MVDPRVYLAIERTFLAWIRTAVAFLAFGVAIEKFDIFIRALFYEYSDRLPQSMIHSAQWLHHVGKILILFGVITLLFGKFNFLRTLKRVELGEFVTAKGVYLLYFLLVLVVGVLLLINFVIIKF